MGSAATPSPAKSTDRSPSAPFASERMACASARLASGTSSRKGWMIWIGTGSCGGMEPGSYGSHTYGMPAASSGEVIMNAVQPGCVEDAGDDDRSPTPRPIGCQPSRTRRSGRTRRPGLRRPREPQDRRRDPRRCTRRPRRRTRLRRSSSKPAISRAARDVTGDRARSGHRASRRPAGCGASRRTRA